MDDLVGNGHRSTSGWTRVNKLELTKYSIHIMLTIRYGVNKWMIILVM